MLKTSWGFLCLIAIIIVYSTFALATNSRRRASIVTGANGYVGREIVHCLMRDTSSEVGAQHDIYCLVRASRVDNEATYWRSISDSIQVLPYNMLDGGKTIREALTAARGSHEDDEDGSSICVYHVASKFGPSDDHIQQAKENVKGTEDLVNAISEFNNCRLVLTSSMAAVRATNQQPSNGQFYTPDDWNTLSTLGENWGSSYQWSKAESERRAWQLAKQHGIKMTSICPSFVFGPPTDGLLSTSYSIELVGKWARGESPVQSRLCVDIRDIAQAHVSAGTKPIAIGKRYIVSTERRLPSQHMADALKRVCVETGLGNPSSISFDSIFKGGAIPVGDKEVESLEQLAELGISLRPVEETVYDMGRALLEAASNVKT